MHPINPHAHNGFSYIGLLILVAIMGVTLAAAGDLWQTTRQREKEDELLYAGHQFRLAIQHFYQHSAGGPAYPQALDDLLKDPRAPNTRRYLRRIYPDPITGTTDWGLVKGPNGEIYGVYSKSDAEPLKKANFNLTDAAFEGAKKYSEWQFVFLPKHSPAAAPRPAAQPGNRPTGPVRRPILTR